MPIIETLEPRAPEELQLKIFATKTGEDYLIIQAVSEHVFLPFSPFCTPSSSWHSHTAASPSSPSTRANFTSHHRFKTSAGEKR
jgi:hypothetical protein